MIQVRRSTYRRQPGYTIRGTDARQRRIRVFATTEGAARHIAAKLRAGDDIDSSDFTVGSS